MMVKLYSVGQFAKLVGVPISTLRYWDRVGLLVPGRSKSRYRYYVGADLEVVREIQNKKGENKND